MYKRRSYSGSFKTLKCRGNETDLVECSDSVLYSSATGLSSRRGGIDCRKIIFLSLSKESRAFRLTYSIFQIFFKTSVWDLKALCVILKFVSLNLLFSPCTYHQNVFFRVELFQHTVITLTSGGEYLGGKCVKQSGVIAIQVLTTFFFQKHPWGLPTE